LDVELGRKKAAASLLTPTTNDPSTSQAWAGQVTRRRLLQAGVVAVGGLALYAGEIERHWLDVHRVEIRLANLPEAFRGFRIVHMADFHYGEYSEPTYLRSVVRAVNALRPDMIALTGDFISAGPMARRISIDFAYHCADLLGKLECRRKFAAMGNHDVLVSRVDVTDALESRGIPVLHNASVPIEKDGARLWLAGVADPLIDPDADLSAAMPRGRDAGKEPLLLMAHEPDYADQVVGSGVDLMLSGHTHGGQVRIPFLPLFDLPPLGKKYVEGHFSLRGLQLYVTRGIGTVGVPFRFRCPPEITLITLV
jgi:predicted MPP superfamily phosphohydrolase